MNRAERLFFNLLNALLRGVTRLESWSRTVLAIPVQALFQYAIFRRAAAGTNYEEDPIPNPWGDPDH